MGCMWQAVAVLALGALSQKTCPQDLVTSLRFLPLLAWDSV